MNIPFNFIFREMIHLARIKAKKISKKKIEKLPRALTHRHFKVMKKGTIKSLSLDREEIDDLNAFENRYLSKGKH